MYKVQLSTKAQKFYQKADRPLAQKLAKCFEQLEQEPHHHPNVKPLSGNLAGLYRYRVGDYRVIYRIDEQQRVVLVVIIAHRSEVYE
jgi:mRNA interferase RelE/StbE